MLFSHLVVKNRSDKTSQLVVATAPRTLVKISEETQITVVVSDRNFRYNDVLLRTSGGIRDEQSLRKLVVGDKAYGKHGQFP